MSFIILTVLFLVVFFGNIGNHLNAVGTAEATDISEQEAAKNAGEQFVVAILPFYSIDDPEKTGINSEFTEALKKRIEEESPDLQPVILENCTDYNEEIARAQGREVKANLIIYGKIKSENGNLEELTYYIIPLSGFDVDPFILKNPTVLAQLSARASCSTIKTEPLVLPEVDGKNYSSLLHAVDSFKEYKKLDFESALNSFQSIESYESNYQLLFYIANCYYFENELNDSCYFYEKALELEPQSTEAMLNKANSLAFLGHPGTIYEGQEEFGRDFDLSWQAIDMYDKIIGIGPQSAAAWSNKGCLLNEMGKPEEALEACEKALEIDPDLELAWRNKGDFLFALGRYDEAVDAYDEALRADSENPGAWCGKASTLLSMGETEEALETCEKGLEANPQSWALWQNKGNALHFSGRSEEALAAYDKTLELNPRFAVAWMHKGIIYEKLGETDRALEAYDAALSIDPYYSTVWYNKGNVYYNAENYEEAIPVYDKCLEVNPEFEYAWLYKAYSLYYLGKYEDSLEATDKVLEINPQSSGAWLNRGDVLSEMERYDESNEAYWKALKCLFKEKIGI
jgi:superkiller protein 3